MLMKKLRDELKTEIIDPYKAANPGEKDL